MRIRRCAAVIGLAAVCISAVIAIPSDDDQMADACIDAAAKQYDVDTNDLALDPTATTADGYTIDGIVDQGTEGKKSFSCMFDKQQLLKEVRALKPDGE
ncbi:hypothetical protein [Pseudomonas sp. R5(2019)]|uniref:hypothetical protein n=1 Tax=Pseudomonas sp. R5(2019) TaxID=2697566 RepID=UPI0014136EEA|nr:hypothetical protein [Pseudomonas sp. R5(2019)]NBA97167.1 hypothetical protein [Pseudomonas sp. R5(2019)]